MDLLLRLIAIGPKKQVEEVDVKSPAINYTGESITVQQDEASLIEKESEQENDLQELTVREQFVSFCKHPLVCTSSIVLIRSFFQVIPILLNSVMEAFAMTALEIAFPLYMEHTMKLDAGDVGLVFGVMNITMGVANYVGGKLSDRFGPKPIVLFGMVMFAGALTGMAFVYNILTACIIAVCMSSSSTYILIVMM